jgi:uncharacterized damage-inducible protein DinB
MAWANQRVYSAVQALPDGSLASYISNPEWTAGVILKHIVDGATWYVYCLGVTMWTDIPDVKTMNDLPKLASMLAEFDAQILSQAELPDESLSIKEGERTFNALRSTILAEASYHATEHRAQLLDALESKGHFPIKLDDIDLWSFERHERTL